MLDQGRIEEAVNCYGQVLTLDPHQVNAWINLGCSLAKLRCMQGAVTCFERALEIAPQNPNILYNKAIIEESRGGGTDVAQIPEVASTTRSQNDWATEAEPLGAV